MTIPAALVSAGKLEPAAIDQAAPAPGELASALAAADGAQAAALAIIAGRSTAHDAIPALVAGLGRDGVAGKAAAWALGRLGAADGAVERQVLEVIAGGGLDARENGYAALAGLAARGVAGKELAQRLTARVQAEIERAKGGGSGLGEHACRVLAVLGAPGLPALIQQVIENDRYCDRFELQRLRKAVEDGGRDQETVRALAAPWTDYFADHLVPPPKPEAPPVEAKKPDAAKPGPVPAAKPPAAMPPAGPAGAPPPADAGADAGEPDEEGADGPAPKPLDWKDFLASPEAKALPPQLIQLAGQLGPLLEQLSARAIRAPLADLTGQEFAALLLQVLPQALPPQHVQMALSPHAMHCYQAIGKWLHRTGAATHGDQLVQGVKLVRQELTNQMRQSGILGGPDYSDPDDKPSAPGQNPAPKPT